jgi:predicted transcriptional regulator
VSTLPNLRLKGWKRTVYLALPPAGKWITTSDLFQALPPQYGNNQSQVRKTLKELLRVGMVERADPSTWSEPYLWRRTWCS